MTVAKRAMDLAVAAVGVALLWPVLLAIAAAIRLEDGGTVFSPQIWVGERGVPSRIWMFRSFTPALAGQPITAEGDARITRVGGWLRRFRLDELPQLLNVLAGEMSLVGPRPELPRFVENYSPEERPVLDFRPGITDPASLRFRDEGAILAAAADPVQTYVERVLPEKLRLSLAYARQATPMTDLRILLATAGAMLGVAKAPARFESPRERYHAQSH
jgi:lipopolysaccharide/colanic/teichoic acid biosynthesis glycosyltransferase